MPTIAAGAKANNYRN